jgi:hypothetical protein
MIRHALFVTVLVLVTIFVLNKISFTQGLVQMMLQPGTTVV